jgi:hypothetical protein
MALIYWLTMKIIRTRNKRIANLHKSEYSFLADKNIKKDKAAVDLRFFKKLRLLLKFLVPSLLSPEVI